MNLKTWTRAELYYPIALILLWAAICAIIGYGGNIPLGDDWAYGRPVLEFLQTGKVHITDWSSMTLVGQIWYGGLVTKIFGFSFEVLRLSTLFLAMSAILASYAIIKRLAKSGLYGFLGALLFAISPHFIRYSFSFCTDIPFFGFSLWGVYFLLRYLDEEKTWLYAVGTAFVAYAFLIRDVAIVIPPAFALAYGLKHKFRLNKFPAMLIINVLIAAEYLLYRYWLTHIHGMTGSMDYSKNMLFGMWTSGFVNIAKVYARNSIFALSYFGLCFFPIIWANIASELKGVKTRLKISFWAVIIAISSVSAFAIYYRGFNTHFYREFLFDFLFRFIPIGSIHKVSNAFTWTPTPLIISIFSIIAVASGFALAVIFISKFWKYVKGKEYKSNSGANILFIVGIIAFYLALILSQFLFNRYIMLMLPFVSAIILANSNWSIRRKFSKGILTTSIVVWGYFTLAGTKDFLSYERAKWQGLNYLTIGKGISPKQIDGGFEFNGWHLYDFHYKKTSEKNWWWVEDDKYVVSYGLIPGYKVIKTIEFSLWLPPGYKSKAVVLVRELD